MSEKNIVYYHPFRLSNNPVKGSEVRPKAMLESFKSLGYNVLQITGDSNERKRMIKTLLGELAAGASYEFAYLESLNVPFPISDKDHLPRNLFWDLKFFMALRTYSIPSGIFYRDVYWREPVLKYEIKNWFKRFVKISFHWLEWFVLSRYVDVLFIPTMGVLKYLPRGFNREKIYALEPGFNISNLKHTPNMAKRLRLLYVGGVTPPYYDLRPLLSYVYAEESLELVLCTRKEEWNDNLSFYEDFDCERIKIIHARSNELSDYYSSTDIVLELREPSGYFKEAFPIKIAEAFGYGIPVICFEGSYVAEFIKENDIGFVVKCQEELSGLLSSFSRNSDLLIATRESIILKQEYHDWKSRCVRVKDILLDLDDITVHE